MCVCAEDERGDWKIMAKQKRASHVTSPCPGGKVAKEQRWKENSEMAQLKSSVDGCDLGKPGGIFFGGGEGLAQSPGKVKLGGAGKRWRECVKESRAGWLLKETEACLQVLRQKGWVGNK